ncbi:hypothetical protein OG604_21780 [Streptomyces sp. NBC_01231]|nr:hypothetical protein OG604_21780 [Streptomyces sp. NBC_01231]
MTGTAVALEAVSHGRRFGRRGSRAGPATASDAPEPPPDIPHAMSP